MARCSKCDTPLSIGAQYCGQCGARANLPEVPETVNQAFNAAAPIFKASDYVVEKFGSPVTSFQIKDSTGVLIAKGTAEIASLGIAYTLKTPDGARIGELRGALALIPNRPYLEILDRNSQPLAVVMMRVAKKPGAGFLSLGVTTWVIATPAGEELATITWKKASHEWTIDAPDGTNIAEAHWDWVEVPHRSYTLKITKPIVDTYFLLATIFANPG